MTEEKKKKRRKWEWWWWVGAVMAVLLATTTFFNHSQNSCRCQVFLNSNPIFCTPCLDVIIVSSFQDSSKYEGMVEDCCCDYQTADSLNLHLLYPLLQQLVTTPFFRYFKVNCNSTFFFFFLTYTNQRSTGIYS